MASSGCQTKGSKPTWPRLHLPNSLIVDISERLERPCSAPPSQPVTQGMEHIGAIHQHATGHRSGGLSDIIDRSLSSRGAGREQRWWRWNSCGAAKEMDRT